MIVPPNMLPQEQGQPSPMEAAGVGLPHMLMAAAEVGQKVRAADPAAFKNKIEMQRTLDDLGGPRQAPAVRPGTPVPGKPGHVISHGGSRKRYG